MPRTDRVQPSPRRRRRALMVGLGVALLLVGGWAGRATVLTRQGRLVTATPAGPEAGLAVGAAGPAPGAPGVGPTRVVAGVPVGWAATRLGAVAAAAAYATTMTAPWFVADPARRRRAIAAIAAPDASARLASEQDAISAQLLVSPIGEGLRRTGVRTLLRAGILGYRVDAFTPTTATVSLWVVVLYGHDGGLAPQCVWGTTEVRLVWAGGDWRLAGLQTIPGPVPTHGPQPTDDAAAVLDQVGTFLEPRYGAG